MASLSSSMSVLGIGAVTPIGRDTNAIAGALRTAMPSNGRVHDELLNDPPTAKRMRRADRYSRMATVAVIDAWNAATPSCENVPLERVGLIVTTGFGPHGRGFKFLDGILDFGDSSALPTDFSHSVHGAAAAHITEILGLRGPALNNADFEQGVEHALLMAQCWLADGQCDRVLVGAVEELGTVYEYAANELLNNSHKSAPLGEGAVFFTLGPPTEGGLAKIGVEPSSDARSLTSFVSTFGLHASSVAFDLLGGLLTAPVGVAHRVDTAATARPSCGARSPWAITFTRTGAMPL